jgi:RNA polymerase subunit RPABC4/transcription elongation factor Spt4
MAEKLISCKACGKEIAKSAKVCPHCGKKNKKPFWQVLLIIIGVIVFISVVANMNNNSTDNTSTTGSAQNEKTAESQKPIEAITIAPDDLFAAYDGNEVKADNTYKGKMVRISGKVGDIGKDILDQPYITFARGEWDMVHVQVYFKKNEQAKMAELDKGQQITIVGRCDGKSMNVIIKDSVFE